MAVQIWGPDSGPKNGTTFGSKKSTDSGQTFGPRRPTMRPARTAHRLPSEARQASTSRTPKHGKHGPALALAQAGLQTKRRRSRLLTLSPTSGTQTSADGWARVVRETASSNVVGPMPQPACDEDTTSQEERRMQSRKETPSQATSSSNEPAHRTESAALLCKPDVECDKPQ